MRPWTVAVVLASVMLGGVCPVHAQPPTREYDIKAAVLLNFSRYVEWPGSVRNQPFGVCTLLPDPFGTRLEAVVFGETWDGQPILVRRLQDARRTEGCHLLYVPHASLAMFVSALSQIARQPILTVGEHPEFLASGGMIHLYIEENRVRFSVNQRVVDATGLRMSSRLLRLARDVQREETE